MTGDDPYRVIWSSSAKATIEALRMTKDPRGVRRRAARALRALIERLQRDPLDLGEAYHVRGNVAQHKAAIDPVAINFAVDKKRKLVHVREVRLMSGPGPKPTD